MDVGAPLVANCQSPKSVKPGECALDNPAIAAESCGRLDATTRDSRPNAAHTAGDPRVSTVVRLVGMELRRTTARSTPRPTNRADRVEEVAKLLRVVFVCSGQLRRCQRNTSPVDNHMVLRARLGSVGRIRTRGRSSLKRAHARSIERRTRPVDLAFASELVLQHLENPLPDPSLLPIAEPAPTCHATSTAKLPRKVLPRNPRPENEQDAGERLAMGNRLATAVLRSFRRKVRGDEVPELLADERACHADLLPRNAPKCTKVESLSSILLGVLRS